MVSLPCQVNPDFESNMEIAEIVGDENDLEQERVQIQKRQRAWVKRKQDGAGDNWRPKKRFRTAAFHWLAQLDHQAMLVISVGLCDLGWREFRGQRSSLVLFCLATPLCLSPATLTRCPASIWLLVKV